MDSAGAASSAQHAAASKRQGIAAADRCSEASRVAAAALRVWRRKNRSRRDGRNDEAASRGPVRSGGPPCAVASAPCVALHLCQRSLLIDSAREIYDISI